MKGMVIVDKGLEEVALEEISNKIKSKGKAQETIVIFPLKKEEDLCKLAYTSQSIRRALLLLKEFKVEKTLQKTVVNFENVVTEKLLKNYSDKIVGVECERIGKHNYNSVDFAKEVSTILNQFNFKIDRKDNQVQFYIYIYQDKGYFCVDFSGRDLSKRNYRIFTKSSTLKGTLAYALIHYAKYEQGEIIIDPNAESGVIPIELALYSLNKPVNFYNKEFAFSRINKKYDSIFEKEDKKTKKKIKGICLFDKSLRNIHSAKKNAKIAGVEKNINFSKADIEWLDTKFEKKTVDKIITKVPSESKRHNKKQVEKIYQELFYQSEFILKDKGLVVICSLKNDLLKNIAKKKGFKPIKERIIYSGQQEFYITIFEKVYKK